MNHEQIQSLLKYLSSSFPNQFDYPTGEPEEDKSMVKVWKDWVGEYSFDEVKKGVKKAMVGNPDFVPSPAKVAQELDTNLTPEEAWEIYEGNIDGENLTEKEREAVRRAGNAVEGSKRDRKIGQRQFIRDSFIEQFRAIRKRDWQQENLPNTRDPLNLPEKEKAYRKAVEGKEKQKGKKIAGRVYGEDELVEGLSDGE